MNFTCPYCSHATTITSPNYSNSSSSIETKNSELGEVRLRHVAISCPNEDCKKLSLTAQLTSSTYMSQFGSSFYRDDEVHHNWQLLPASSAQPQPDYIPSSIIEDYYESCAILKLSPKASATLSRRCLQGIVRDYWAIPKSKSGNLGAELNYIKDKVDPDTWEGIHAIRSVGDIGAHMEKDVNYVVDVEDHEAELLKELIEMLFTDWYVAKHKRQERAMKAKALSQAKLGQKRAAKKASTNAADNSDNEKNDKSNTIAR